MPLKIKSCCLFLVLSFFSVVFFALGEDDINASVPSLEFEPSKIILGVGERITVDLNIDTGGNQVAGAGVKIEYNPNIVSVVSIQTDGVFGDYPSATFNNDTGKLAISGIVSSASNLYTGQGKFGSITFQGIKEGEADVEFEFEKGSTTDSNIAVSYGIGDVLEKVNSLTVSVIAKPQATSGPTIPLTSEDIGGEVGGEPKRGFVGKVLEFFGIGGSTKDKLDPYEPIPSQSPNTNAFPFQLGNRVDTPRVFERPKSLLVVGLIVLTLLIVLLAVVAKRRGRSKGSAESVVNDSL